MGSFSSRLPTTLSVSPGLRYATFFTLYVAQGVPAGFARTTVANHLVARGLGPVEVGTYLSIIGLPWAFQVAWGVVVDRFPCLRLNMGRRKPWVMVAQLLTLAASVAVIAVRDPAAQLPLMTTVFFLHAVFASLQDTSVDAMAIAVTPTGERGRMNAFSQAGFAAGIGLGAAGLAPVLQAQGFRTAAVAETLALLAVLAITFLIRERPGDRLLPTLTVASSARRPSPATAATESPATEDPAVLPFPRLLATLAREILRPATFVTFLAIAAAYVAQVSFMTALPRHLIAQLRWSDASVSVISGLYGPAGALLVNLAGGWLADRIGARRLLVSLMLAAAAFLALFSAFPASWGTPGVGIAGLLGSQLIDPCLSVAALPLLMNFCRRGFEGSQFTAYMALVNFSDTLGTYFAGRALLVLPVAGLGWISAATLAAAAVVVHATAPVSRAAALTTRERGVIAAAEAA